MRISVEWRRRELVQIFKNKGDLQGYRGIKLKSCPISSMYRGGMVKDAEDRTARLETRGRADTGYMDIDREDMKFAGVREKDAEDRGDAESLNVKTPKEKNKEEVVDKLWIDSFIIRGKQFDCLWTFVKYLIIPKKCCIKYHALSNNRAFMIMFALICE